MLTRDAGDGVIQFRTAAARFHLIDDSAYQTILVRYDNNDALLGQLKKEGPHRWLMRKLQRYSVNLPRHVFAQLEAKGDVYQIWPGIYAQTSAALYNDKLGVVFDSNITPDSLVI
ncbi:MULTISPECIES: hypothetical protein [Nitrosomonas]|uniref:Uncharacterized protein n=1 Tax=Nitrosomonas eutropha TaxID=916 RepID=A0ABX5M6W1_9PROT|nr:MULTISPECIES: hypothetical protein [Nitrosomonas]PXV81059.1 hypothetical protein C8R14_11337 [Nitrosomonas eutropha]SEI97453.1 CRISPR-associated endonuclease/helicase Cas3 [Nitrosomonas eutropha]